MADQESELELELEDEVHEGELQDGQFSGGEINSWHDARNLL